MSLKKEDKIYLDRYLDKLRMIRQYSNVNLNETKAEKRERINAAKKNYAICVNYYFPHYATSDCADFQIEAAEYIKNNKECIDAEVWARGHAKSTHLDIMIPFWLWMNDEINVMLLVGKNDDDARILLSDLQAEFEANPQIIADFGEQKTLGSWEAGNFITKNEVAFFSLGRDQNPRGVRYRNKRPNICIFDDIDDDQMAENPKRVLKAVKRIFSAFYGTMDNEGSRFIFANNLISNSGIIANVIKKIASLKSKNARVNIINALDKNGEPTWYQKYTKDFFLNKQQVMGDYNFQTEYQNNPQIEGKIFLQEQIQFAPMPRLDMFEAIVGHWDVAYAGTSTADYNAIKIWGLKNNNFYCIKAFVRQCKMAEAIQWMIDFDESLPKSLKITWRFESQFWNDALKMVLREVCAKNNSYNLALSQAERPVSNKFQRMISMQPYYQNRRIYYNILEQYNLDMQTGINQLKSIEPGYTTHDDSPDCDEAAISYLSKFVPTNNPLPEIGQRHTNNGAW
jgi:phage terminase large subunit-like protein/Fe-S-cluster formation regulator IscX/YfhJ